MSTVYADGETGTTDVRLPANNAATTNTNSPEDLARFLAANPGLAQQVSDILQGQEQPTVAENSPASDKDKTAATQNATTQSTSAQKNTPSNPWYSEDEIQQAARDQAFSAVANTAFPLTPQQIQTLNNMLDATQRAQATPPNMEAPQPTSTSLIVNLSPGATPPVIRLSRGFVSSLVFIDSTGAPWPIESYDIGNPGVFNITWDKKSNTLMVQARATYTYGNLAVKLVKLDTPVMLTLVPGQKVVDYRVDLRMEGLGPNARPGMQGAGLPGQADQNLLNILDAVPPQGARRLSVSENIAQVWIVGNNTMYVRSQFTLISPAWISKMSSADGMNAYQLQPTPMLLLSRYGKVLQIKVEGL
jgi:intracellular multiplication protein IcmK